LLGEDGDGLKAYDPVDAAARFWAALAKRHGRRRSIGAQRPTYRFAR
jgi:hypothetical protein